MSLATVIPRLRSAIGGLLRLGRNHGPDASAFRELDELLPLLLTLATGPQNTLFVYPDATGPGQRNTFNAYPSIEDALVDYQDGDVIYLLPAQYTPAQTILLPNVRSFNLIGWGGSQAVQITPPPASNLFARTVGDNTPQMWRFEGFTINDLSTGFTFDIGDPTVDRFAADAYSLLMLRDIRGTGSFRFRRLGRVRVESCQFSDTNYVIGCSDVRFVDCEAAETAFHYLTAVDNYTTALGRVAYRLENSRFYDILNIEGTPYFVADHDSQAASIIATLRSTVALDPVFNFHGVAGLLSPDNSPQSNGPVTQITFEDTPWVNAGFEGYLAGMDLSDARFYGDIAVEFQHALAVPLTDSMVYFGGRNIKFFGNFTGFQAAPGAALYKLDFRGCAIQDNGPNLFNIVAAEVEIDVRGSNIAEAQLSDLGLLNGAFDRDHSIAAIDLAIGATTGTQVFPVRFPSYLNPANNLMGLITAKDTTSAPIAVTAVTLVNMSWKVAVAASNLSLAALRH